MKDDARNIQMAVACEGAKDVYGSWDTGPGNGMQYTSLELAGVGKKNS